ncbi:hypothetical protein [Colwellia psychrerythraea]|uniref:Uncharacterized protein n=1 Tax=Colwellia psychrerythraea TaxID=28229 RepID=A0A099K8D3_COLPS|nr:hypothetical protein [Colwellia psychrerythraea]KGJ86586.1 hypothetical protein ND2E_0758 [Colwellia psychrerythraea]
MIKLFSSIPRALLAAFKLFAVLTGLFTLSYAHAKSEKPAKWHEADFVEAYCEGKVEHVLADKTRVDCLTATHAIEYDWGKKWAESLGQALFYSAMTGKKAGIVLIVNPRTKERYLKRLNKAILDNKLDVDVWTITNRKT